MVWLALTVISVFLSIVNSQPELRQWREFVYGKVSPDGVEYFDFEVKEDAFTVFLAFDRGKMHGRAPPQMIIKYGAIPTLADYDQLVHVNGTTDFHSAQISNLRFGRYFVALFGGSLYDSLTHFVGTSTDMFFYLNIWYFGCSDSSVIGSDCSVPVMPATAISTPVRSDWSNHYNDDLHNFGCLDLDSNALIYQFDVVDAEWDIEFELATDWSQSITLAADVNVADPTTILDSATALQISLPPLSDNTTTSSRSLRLRVTAPTLGRWLVVVTVDAALDALCANNTGVDFSLGAQHNRTCTQDNPELVFSVGSDQVNICAGEVATLNLMAFHPDKTDLLLQTDFASDDSFYGEVQEADDGSSGPVIPFPQAIYRGEFPRSHAGALLKLSATVSTNIRGFRVAVLDRYDNGGDGHTGDHSQHSDHPIPKVKGLQLQSYDWPPLTFPRVGTWFLLFLANESVPTPSAVAGNRSYWFIDVSLHTDACLPGACNGHGDCTMSETYQELQYSACSCHFGFGGEQCDVRTLSAQDRDAQISLLIASNAAIVPVTVLCSRRKLYIESVLFACAGLVSALYHACDVELLCVLPYRFLQQMDFALAFNMILVLSVHLSGVRKQAKAGLLAFLLLATIFLATIHTTSMVNWLVTGVIATVQFAASMGNYFAVGLKRLNQGKRTALRSFLFQSGNFDRRFGLLGIILWVVALACWFLSTPTNYWLVHSFWHMTAMLAAFCFIGLRANDRYRMLNAAGDDVLGPQVSNWLSTTSSPIDKTSLTSVVAVELTMDEHTSQRMSAPTSQRHE